MENSIIAKLAGISNDITLAAASLNFDFTLIKVEAPKEYSGVNDSLSEIRRDSAENGALHRTARKLGALFDGIPPSAGHLLAAYGKRVSEICQKARIKPQDRERQGIFAQFCGTDSGSLWAAATSGTNAIAIHLLACMMAEAFGGPESVALWWQLIERRRAEIGNPMGEAGSIDMAKLLASKQEFTRHELASWDNSARSWIHTANKKTKNQRNTVLHYTDTAGLAVNRDSDPYHSVMQAWKDAMSSMDSLIMGVPQKVRNGAIILAMRSWHLYPDLCVLNHGPDVISQKDELIPKSGIITIDLEHSDDTSGSISWSLPLSYLRYYGDPVIVNQTLGVSSNRISMDQFRFVLLGCVISTWSTFTKSVSTALDLLMALIKALRWLERSHPVESNLKRMDMITSKTSWLGQILTATEDLSSGSDIERGMARKLIEYGRRYGQFLCNRNDHPPPFFGLSYIPSMFSLLKDTETRIGFLRKYAKILGLSNSNCVIRYVNNLNHHEFATIEPINEQFGRKDLNGYICGLPHPSILGKHLRWISVPKAQTPCLCEGRCLSDEEIYQQDMSTSKFRFRRKKKEQPLPCPCIGEGGCSINCHSKQKGHSSACVFFPLKSRIDNIQRLGEECLPVLIITSIRDPNHGQLAFGSGENFLDALAKLSQAEKFVTLEFCVGDSKRAEILHTGPMTEISRSHDPRKGQLGHGSGNVGRYFSADTIKELFKGHDCNYYELTEWFTTHLRNTHPVFTQTLRGCASALKMYELIPDATVDPTIVGKISLADAPWISPSESQPSSPLRQSLSRPEAFACITMFECGRLLDVTHFQEVFAITSNDSIFVATPLLADPYDAPIETEIKQVSGNIGRPGVALLVPPPEPRIRKNTDEWNLLNHNSFSGEIENHFQKTSMHLSLTQYHQGLLDQTKNEHHIDNNTVLHEALVQVFDGSAWVGDLDILSALSSSLISRVICNCSNGEQSVNSSLDDFQAAFNLIMVDNWEELLIPPLDPGISVVRTAENWIGRLAAASISVRLGRLTVVLPCNKCWGCTKNHIERLSRSKKGQDSDVSKKKQDLEDTKGKQLLDNPDEKQRFAAFTEKLDKLVLIL